MVDDIVGILDLCQTSDDEPALLTEVCRRVRHRLKAVATGIAVRNGSGFGVLSSDGGRIDMAVAERAASAGITIAPHRCDDRVEAAAAIRYGGNAIAVLVARWTLGTLHDLAPATALLAATAAAVAP